MADRELLGEIITPSGTVLIPDMGYLYLWSHDRAPIIPEGWSETDSIREAANSSVDLRLEGKDAKQVGKLLSRQWNPEYLFDMPQDAIERTRADVAKVAREHNLSASVAVLPERISHRKRVDLALAHRKEGGEFQVHGIWNALAGGLPRNRSMPVFAERMPAGKHEGRWQRIYLECAPDVAIANSELLGYTMVDFARLMFADVDALAHWKHEDSLDGKADFVFWGRDAEQLASVFKAPKLSDDRFGWEDLPINQAVTLAEKVREERDRRDLKFGTDFRSHSHHHEVLKQIRTTPTESGTIDLGGARLCGFMTSWGDGLFEVYRDIGPVGELARIRIELGTPQRLKLMDEVEARWQELARCAFVSAKALEPTDCIRYLYREAPDREQDSGWRVFAGDESDEYANDVDNIRKMSLQDLIDHDRALEKILFSPPGSAFERDDAHSPFRKCDPPPAEE
jgi:hypothetical protein